MYQWGHLHFPISPDNPTVSGQFRDEPRVLMVQLRTLSSSDDHDHALSLCYVNIS